MFTHSLHRGINRGAIFHWFLLSFLAGNVNAGGYLACSRFVTHVTGFATLAGIDFARGKWDAAAGVLSVPLFFLFGVMISAYWVDRRVQNGKKPYYSLVMLLVAVCLITVTLAGRYNLFSDFGTHHLKRDFILLALLCMASGLQNAAITTSSGATVRTTHLTGITTDLGLGLMRMITHPRASTEYIRERRRNFLRAGTIFSFMLGSAAGAFLFIREQYMGFLLPAGIALYAMVVALRDQYAPYLTISIPNDQ